MRRQRSLSPYAAANTAPDAEHPLCDLLPEDNERGWHVARNFLKALGHLRFLQRKEQIATDLHLHNIHTPRSQFMANYRMLARHQADDVPTAEVIRCLADQMRCDGKPSPVARVRSMLRRFATIAHAEFHPSDNCNLSCTGCTYGHDNPHTKPQPVNFPFRDIPKIARLKPRSMVICGGGEPCLYRDADRALPQLVAKVVATNPGIQLALVTNGTHKPPGDWPNRLDWVRISLDAAKSRTYAAVRGKPVFHRVLNNFLSYLDHEVGHVGIGFLFSRCNVHEYADVAKLIFRKVARNRPDALHKVNIQYRPLRRDPRHRGQSFAEAITADEIAGTVNAIRTLADTREAMRRFLRDQTNITAVLGGNCHVPLPFTRCYYSEIFRIVRANGDLRPCFVRVAEPDFDLGNILSDDLETVALNTMYVAARRKRHCSPQGCRQCHINHILEQGLIGNLKPSRSRELAADKMF